MGVDSSIIKEQSLSHAFSEPGAVQCSVVRGASGRLMEPRRRKRISDETMHHALPLSIRATTAGNLCQYGRMSHARAFLIWMQHNNPPAVARSRRATWLIPTFIRLNSRRNTLLKAAGDLFDLSHEIKRVCLIQYQNDGWFLPEGRRNFGESRHAAALREAEEETRYKCRVYPISMLTGAPQPDDPEDVPDMARLLPDLSEPLMLTVRSWTGELMSELFGATLPWLTVGLTGAESTTPRIFPPSSLPVRKLYRAEVSD
jgi:8-oxo-dGTP pyrophosphatase MutT (NUDIX family)